MMGRAWLMACVMGMATVAAPVGAAQAADPFLGTWKLNLEHSSFPGVPPSQPYLLTFEPGADGSVVGVAFDLDARDDHRIPVGRIVYRYDGMDYRDQDLVTGQPAPNTLAFTQIDARTVQVVHKLNEGRSVYRETRTVSDDGRTMTFVLTATDLQGSVSVVQVFDRQ